MATYSRQLLSGSTNGKPINIASTATIIHTAVSGTTSFDEIYVWAANIDTAAATLTIEWGGSTDAELACKTISLPANSPPIPIMTGQVLQNGMVCKGLAVTTLKVNVTGYVNRIA